MQPAHSIDQEPRKYRQEQKLWHDAKFPVSLGCSICPERAHCGGLALSKGGLDCLSQCCGGVEGCDVVCRLNPTFTARLWEVDGFDLSNIPRAESLSLRQLPLAVPMIFHGSARVGILAVPVVALPLYALINRRGEPRFADRSALCVSFGIQENSRIVASGVSVDGMLERWWKLSSDRRRVIAALQVLGVEIATTPNFSMFIDQPRWDDLHAMKRIATTFEEFLSSGLQAALHVNGRTPHDFRRWAEFIRQRPEVQAISYEFTTGTSNPKRRRQHIQWLCELAVAVERPLSLIVRGGVDHLEPLAANYDRLCYIETTGFMKAMKRQIAVVSSNGKPTWEATETPHLEPIDDLLEHNLSATLPWAATMASKPVG